MNVCDKKNKINILVTGVGAIIGYGIIKSLRKTDLPVHIVGMDIYDDAVGQHWCDKFIKAKYAVDIQYIDFLKSVIEENAIDLVFFGTEQEIYRCSDAQEELGEYYNKLVINKSEILRLSSDKWLTREALYEKGLEEYAIPSVIEGEYNEISNMWGTEFLLKPRCSYASKGIHKVSDKEKFDFYKAQMGSNFMAQYLVGDNEHEYTVGVFGLGDGTYSEMIQLKRKLSQEGATAKAECIGDTELREAVVKLCKAFKPIGPTNFQFRRHEERIYLLEVNPRISSSTSIRTAFGYNEAEMSVMFYLHGQIICPKVKKGTATRFIDEVVVIDE